MLVYMRSVCVRSCRVCVCVWVYVSITASIHLQRDSKKELYANLSADEEVCTLCQHCVRIASLNSTDRARCMYDHRGSIFAGMYCECITATGVRLVTQAGTCLYCVVMSSYDDGD